MSYKGRKGGRMRRRNVKEKRESRRKSNRGFTREDGGKVE